MYAIMEYVYPRYAYFKIQPTNLYKVKKVTGLLFSFVHRVRFCHPIMLSDERICQYNYNESVHRKEQLATIINMIGPTVGKKLTLLTFAFAKRRVQCNIAHRFGTEIFTGNASLMIR